MSSRILYFFIRLLNNTLRLVSPKFDLYNLLKIFTTSLFKAKVTFTFLNIEALYFRISHYITLRTAADEKKSFYPFIGNISHNCLGSPSISDHDSFHNDFITVKPLSLRETISIGANNCFFEVRFCKLLAVVREV